MRFIRPILGVLVVVVGVLFWAFQLFGTLVDIVSAPSDLTTLSGAARGALVWVAQAPPGAAYLFGAALTLLGFAILLWHPGQGWHPTLLPRKPHSHGNGADRTAATRAAEGAESSVAPQTMSFEEKSFRSGLRQFVCQHPRQLLNAVDALRFRQMERVKSLGDQDYSFILHHAVHAAWSATDPALLKLEYLGRRPLEDMDIAAIREALEEFLHAYEVQVQSLANLNVLAKLDLDNDPAAKNLPLAERESYLEAQRLIALSEEAGFLAMGWHQMRLPCQHENWQKPIRVNF